MPASCATAQKFDGHGSNAGVVDPVSATAAILASSRACRKTTSAALTLPSRARSMSTWRMVRQRRQHTVCGRYERLSGNFWAAYELVEMAIGFDAEASGKAA